ncbi:hypothetical protein [Lentzea sp. NPDC051838]|uniref:hypothetical protein n=1 Tax=Lentzea sp. NPDC051838 TaxID=3154849 RepID=UPI00341E5F3C
MRRRTGDRQALLEVCAAAVLMLMAVFLGRWRSRSGQGGEVDSAIKSKGISSVDPLGSDGEGRENAAGFRLLVTILAGVALGSAASVLPALMSTTAVGDLWLALWIFWVTGAVAVVLAYLSTLTGSKVIPNEIGFAHTVTLVGSFLAQCGLFTSLAKTNVQSAVKWWLASFSAFGVMATAAILLGLIILPRSTRDMDSKALAFYRRGQWTDVVMTTLTAVISMLYLVLVRNPSDRASLVVSAIALLSILSACAKQSFERKRMRRDGLI